jgi:hypothetical protein
MWPIIGTAAILLLLGSSFRGAQKIAVNVQGASARFVNGIPTIILTFRIFNPGIIGARINSIVGAVMLTGSQIGSIEFNTPVTIPPNGIVNVNIPIKITVGILPTLISLISGKLKGYSLTVKGTAFTLAGLSIDFENTIQLS